MKSALDAPVRAFYGNQRRGPVLGSEQFIERTRRRMRKRGIALTEVPDAKAYLRLDAEICLKAVGQVYGRRREAILQGRRGQRDEARALAMYKCRRLAGLRLQDIARLFGVGGYSAVSSVIGRTQGELQKGGEMARRFQQIRRCLQGEPRADLTPN